ncbi:hypothetical protein B0H21DRAFT_817934 [Amylocystis lapponica]|nr:hypothetical protein B0H21DRAFT_817934 [Amylocystis lapponica]
MASTFSLSSNSSSLPSLTAPPPTHDTSMQQILVPNVFVIPPEEEQDENPPWCYFDATEAFKGSLSRSPDLETLAVALNFHQQTDNRAPAFHRALGNDSQETVVMPRRSSITWLHNSGREDAVRGRELGEEIVEVIKVRRNEGLADVEETQPQTMKKSKTFRARATQAFMSIKNVRKGSRRTSVTETWAAEENPRELEDNTDERNLPRADTPNLGKRRSVVFSQLFTFNQNSRSSAASSGVPPSPTSPTSPTLSAVPPRTSISSSLSTSSSHAMRLHPSPSLEDCMDPPSSDRGYTFPQPSLSKKKSFRRRLSVLELQRLFTSSGPAESATASSAEELPSPPSRRSKSSELLRDIFRTHESRPCSPDSADMAYSSSSSFPLAQSSPPAEDDTELEMRLDSLQFDSLHFDPEEF